MAAFGGGAGILLAYFALMPLRAFVPAEMLSGAPPKMDLTVLLFTAALSAGAGILFGVLPAAGLASRDLNGILADNGRSATGGRQARRVQNILVSPRLPLPVC